ncbi:hypothetical protein [Mesorhizobium caraganae]|uniref:hypothetical protein n=1 Tax=Mesorhizobium caraganae TaxID=483206 RepID=UPI003ECFE9F9
MAIKNFPGTGRVDKLTALVMRFDRHFEETSTLDSVLVQKLMELARAPHGGLVRSCDIAKTVHEWTIRHNGLHQSMQSEIDKAKKAVRSGGLQ